MAARLWGGRTRVFGATGRAVSIVLCGVHRLTSWPCASPTDRTKSGSVLALACPGSEMTFLDVSGLTDLGHLDCSDHLLRELELSTLPRLRSLRADGNPWRPGQPCTGVPSSLLVQE